MSEWRVGRKVGRTIYDADDNLIGVMDTREYAALAAAAPSLVALLEELLGRAIPGPSGHATWCSSGREPAEECHICGVWMRGRALLASINSVEEK